MQCEHCSEATLVDALKDTIKPKKFIKHLNLRNNIIFSSTKEKLTEKYHSLLADKIYLNSLTKKQAFVRNWLWILR